MQGLPESHCSSDRRVWGNLDLGLTGKESYVKDSFSTHRDNSFKLYYPKYYSDLKGNPKKYFFQQLQREVWFAFLIEHLELGM